MAAWTPVDVWAPIAAGLALLTAFVMVELRIPQPSFDPRLLAQRTFGGGNAAIGLLLFAMTASGFYGAFYLQGARGFSPLEAGLASSPGALGAIIGGPLGIRLVRRWGLRPVTATALTIAALAMGSFVFFGLETSLVWLELVLSVQGISIGIVIGSVTAALMNTLPLERMGAGSAVTNTVRQTGSVLGIAIGGTIMSLAYRRGIDSALPDVAEPVRDQARISAEQARHIATTIDRPDLAAAADNAFIHAMHVGTVWTMLIALAGAAVLVSPCARSDHRSQELGPFPAG